MMADNLLSDPLLKEVPVVSGYKVLDRCILYAEIGKGGMGTVYRGWHVRLDLDVAVKCLRPDLAASRDEIVLRFNREAKLAARVHHQNLIRVFDLDQRCGVHYLVMEYVRGESLHERVARKGALDYREALAITVAAARGLAAAHAVGIIHRDIKPDNILISAEGEVKLADLGLGGLRRAPRPGDDAMNPGITKGWEVWGTPRYMPPEQWQGLDKVGTAGDVWALGATLLFLLNGKDAIQGTTRLEIEHRVCTTSFPDLRDSQPQLAADFPELRELLRKATDSEASKRYPTARELASALDDLCRLRGIQDTIEFDPKTGDKTQRCTEYSPVPGEVIETVRKRLSSTGPDPTRTAPRGKKKRSKVRILIEVTLAVIVAAGVGLGVFAPSEWWSRIFSSGPAVVKPPPKEPEPPPVESVPKTQDSASVLARARELVRDPKTIEEGVRLVDEVLKREPGSQEAKAFLKDQRLRLAEHLRQEDRLSDAYAEAMRAAADDPANFLAKDLVAELRGNITKLVETGLKLDSPGAGDVVPEVSVYVKGRLEVSRGVRIREVRVTRENRRVSMSSSGRLFGVKLDGLAEGSQEWAVEAEVADDIVVKRPLRFTVDTQPPDIVIESPKEGSPQRSPVRFAGTVKDSTDVTLSIDPPQKTKIEAKDGRWEVVLDLPDGQHSLKVTAKDATGKTTTKSRAARVSSTLPSFTVEAPPLDERRTHLTSRSTVDVAVKVERGEVESLAVGGTELSRQESGVYTASLTLRSEGPNTFNIEAKDLVGGSVQGPGFTVVWDKTPPELKPPALDALPRDARGRPLVSAERIEFECEANDPSGVALVSVNAEPLRSAPGGKYAGAAALPKEGENTLTLKARDMAGNETPAIPFTVVRDRTPPVIVVKEPALDANRSALTSKAEVQLEVAVGDDNGVALVTLDKKPLAAGPGGSYRTSLQLRTEAETTFRLDAKDAAGNDAKPYEFKIRLDRTPPVVVVTEPRAGIVIQAGPVKVRGTVADASETRVLRVNGVQARVGARSPGTFVSTWEADAGVDETNPKVSVEAQDAAGNSLASPVVVSLDVRAGPEIAGFRYLGPTKGSDGKPLPYAEYVHQATGIVLVLLRPPKEGFAMGSGAAGSTEEKHTVTLDPFLIAKYELSQAEWVRLMGDRDVENPSQFKGESLPVDNVTWAQARAFCEAAALALPSEAQWEYACRAGTSTTWAFGTSLDPKDANFIRSGLRQTSPVSSGRSNVFGLYGMHGNVIEWCEDLYDPYFYRDAASKQANPVCTKGTRDRVARGGSFRHIEADCGSTRRHRRDPTVAGDNIGFRPVFQLPAAR